MKKIVLIIFLLQVYIIPQYLSVPLVFQSQDQWCWAGVSSSILGYYGVNKSDCQIAEYARTVITWHNFGTTNCCVNPSLGCNYWNYNWGTAGSIQDILQVDGIQNNGVASYLSKTECQTEVSASRPFVIRWGWTGGGGHFIVGHGINVSASVLYVMNPWPGEGFHVLDYNWTVSSSDHNWTHTNVITTNPVKPSVPVLNYPANNASIVIPQNVVFKWLRADRAQNYSLQIASDSLFNNVTFSKTLIADTLYSVPSITGGGVHYWRVQSKNANGGLSDYSSNRKFSTISSGVELNTQKVPVNYMLHNAYPNPFNPSTRIDFDLPQPGAVKIVAVNLLGQVVAEVVNENLQAGSYSTVWDASKNASGIYFIRLITSNYTAVKKVVLSK
ncbi:MAG: T9SS type A sorting domain-containing protein [Bacteroidota bacterium]|nr:T9SS type A sorting domain-containing protein [Bacteroidota bacterium]